MNCTYAPSLKLGQHLPPTDELDTNVLQHPLVFLELEVCIPVDVGKAPLLRNDDFLTTGELVPGTTEGLLDDVGVGVLATDG